MPLLLLWFCLTLAALALPQPPRVVVISIDGLRPEFYLDPSWPAPNLQSLRQNGAWAESMQSVFPSITYANHSSLVTGVSPARHGIDCNIDFDWKTGPRLNWNWEAARLRQPALWDLTRAAGLRSTAFSWPVSVGAPIDDNVPEIFSVAGANVGTTEELLRLHSTQGLLEEIQQECSTPFPQTFAEWDQWLPTAFARVWTRRPADLTLIHMLNLDWTQHRFGPHSAETRQALAELDRQLGQIISLIRRQQDFLLVLGDHGFLEVTRNLSPNQLFYERGWIQVKEGRIQSWKVYARSNGGSAAIYCKDDKLRAAVQRLLQRYQPSHWTILSQLQLEERKTFTGAHWAISVRPGFGLSQGWEGPFEKATERPFGQHGHLPAAG
jgi:predicted AlkP superfamily pyrophosphatase or phosphodiesterase